MTQDQGTVEWTSHDLIALQVLRPLLDEGGYLPWSSGAMRASGLVTLCNEIVLAGRRRVLELGSGTSTLLLARLLREQDRGGTLVAVEHHPEWATWVGDRLAAEGLASIARVVVAPLAPHPLGRGRLPWYDAAAFATAMDGPPVDVLIVDGPPAFRSDAALARYPALPAALPALDPGGIVVLDDIVRTGEAEILERWEDETDYRFERRPLEGIAVGRVDPPA
ncbi:class I SAM-dependent methyltransferase [Patulibacter sp. NPDC049589]|uniref:class I SAM-dependent methyltransferase n=1 Tax=Patulibacter sp. NPDC049589 TaxID=3154731 RepID=UPI0034441F5A